MKTYKFIPLFFLILGITSCKNNESEYDASGTFETTEVIVSAESMGKIMEFNVIEGQELKENEVIGYIDSTQIYLKKLQLKASQQSLLSRRPDLKKQIAALEQQLATARHEKKRVENLVKADAGTTKQLDDLTAQVSVLEKQLAASRSTLETTLQGISNDNQALDIQARQLDDQLEKCRIISPVNGTVLVKYAEKGELAAAGKALFKVGDTQNMIFRAYITADQLSQIKSGQKVQVFADYKEDEAKPYDGIITWISSKSEFTPKTIQTRDERANLVYAVKVLVKNDGYLKIGQYGFLKIN
jgi:HlyD family secretion protein